MPRLNPRNTIRRPARPVTRTLTVCVVDPEKDDYEGWDDTAEARRLQLKFCATAEEALRVARTFTVDLWVVNTELPGLSGFELCSMLKSRSPTVSVYLAANEYSVEVEQSAWYSQATAFLCKPAHHDVLSGWLARARGVPTANSSSARITV